MKRFWNKQRLALGGVAALIVMALAYPLTYWLKHRHVNRMHYSCTNHAHQLTLLAVHHMQKPRDFPTGTDTRSAFLAMMNPGDTHSTNLIHSGGGSLSGGI